MCPSLFFFLFLSLKRAFHFYVTVVIQVFEICYSISLVFYFRSTIVQMKGLNWFPREKRKKSIEWFAGHFISFPDLKTLKESMFLKVGYWPTTVSWVEFLGWQCSFLLSINPLNVSFSRQWWKPITHPLPVTGVKCAVDWPPYSFRIQIFL